MRPAVDVDVGLLSGAKTTDGLPNDLLKNVVIHPKLLPLFPQFDPASPEYQADPAGVQGVSASASSILAKADPTKLPPQNYLFMARSPATTTVTLADVFGSPTSILLDFGDALDGGHIYDVIFSISVRTPVPQLTTSPAVLAI